MALENECKTVPRDSQAKTIAQLFLFVFLLLALSQGRGIGSQKRLAHGAKPNKKLQSLARKRWLIQNISLYI